MTSAGKRFGLRAFPLFATTLALLAPATRAKAVTLEEAAAERVVTAEPRTVVRPRYPMAERFDVGLLGGMSLSDRLVKHSGGAVALDYNFNDAFALEVFGGGGASTLVNLVNQDNGIRDLGWKKSTIDKDLEGSGKPVWTAQLGGRYTPLYGKFNLASELSVHFHFYVMAGLGMTQVAFEPVLTAKVTKRNSKGDPTARTPLDSTAGPVPSGNLGLGLRVWLNQLFSLRFEVRQLMFQDQYYTLSADDKKAERSLSDITKDVTPEVQSALGNMTLFYAGIGMTFPPAPAP